MLQRKYFECFASVGRPIVPDRDLPYDVKSLLDDMRYARIHGAAVMHNAAKEFSFDFGNRAAMERVADSSRLFPLAVVASTAPAEMGNDAYFNDLLDGGMRGFVTLYKSSFCGLMTPKHMEKMAEALVTHGRPLMLLNVNSEDQYAKVDVLAEAFPELQIIMQGTNWTSSRYFFDVMGQHENVYFEMSSNHTNKILELTKKHFGIERALYSSMWPVKSMGAMKSMIEYADISEAEKDLVAAGNACRLFGIDEDSLELYDDAQCQWDEIARAADAGEPIPVPVIDAHTHTVSGDYCGMVNNVMIDTDVDATVEKMDRLGVDMFLTAPWSGLGHNGIMANEEVLSMTKKYPGKVFGYSCANVNYAEDLEAVSQYHEQHPDTFVGIKPYPPSQKRQLNEDVYKDWLNFANEHHLFALIHAESPAGADQVDMICDNYPNVTFILAHSGASFYMARYNAAIANRHPNVVLDITYTTTGRGMVEFLVDQVGADKVIYGSDMPMRDPSPQLGWVCYAKLSTEDKKKVLAENIQRLMDKRV